MGSLPGRNIVLVAAASLGLTGCYTSRFDQINQEMAEIRADLRRLAAEDSLRAQALEDNANEARAVARAEASSRHQELLERIENLEATLSTGPEGSRPRETRTPGAGTKPPGKSPGASSQGAAVSPAVGVTLSVQDSAAAAPVGNNAEMRAAYDAARTDLTRGNFELAEKGFREFIRLYPTSDLADNAQYWLGECFYTQNLYEESVIEFSKVVDTYPDGDKVAGALLKMGFSNLAIGQKREGTSLLKRVASEYPGTPEARQAEEKLQELATSSR